ncbi:Relaxase/Mobilisation nuclease domain-containing protein [Chryseobacterium piscicola]|uniref:Relaxase/Mobilisation nuclease domain-containing protein n=1 Tax=Chryseobacterium piscicola TaxID=551459 RepID=A0A1N7PEU2_9FLAO|nr:relaxase/mobilization nuclease domain-containing protein [Chryseobacterium piscicola]PQA89956.1 hypothetical protein B0A70_15350 [Chryseobacterium piscicola]SIT09132.1 Relaxase/Mobilisation nuclease domain-containing protein [Chryseobacterium piscicola]
MVFGTVAEQAYLMRSIAVRNARSSRPVLHLSISFHQEEKISEEMREVIFDKILEELGATRDNNQFIIAQHFDAAHEHYHIVLNKVGFDRSNINTSYIINKCQVIADKIELEVGLRRTLGRTVVYDPTNPKGFRYTTQEERNEKKIFLDKSVGIRDVKTFLRNNIDVSMQQTFNVKELLEKLEEIGIDCNANFNSEGFLKGISFRYNNQAYKGTQLGLKSKAIENYYSLKNKDSIVENEKANEVPIPADKIIRSEKQIFDETKKELLTAVEKLTNFGDHYKNTTQEIAEKIRAGENRKDVLLQTFVDSNFKIQDDQLIYGRYSFDLKVVDDWIDRSILSFQKQVMEFERKKLDYDTLMSQNQQDISFFMLPGTRTRIKSENKELKSKQELAKTPELEISGIGNETSFQQKIISQIKKYKEKLQDIEFKERLRISHEREVAINKEAEKSLSHSDFKSYSDNRMKYSTAEDYKTNFLEYYKHESTFKDLLWLDKRFSILENEDDKIEFLKENFGLNDKEAFFLSERFFESNERIGILKKEIINWLPDRLIRDGENENKIDIGMRLR